MRAAWHDHSIQQRLNWDICGYLGVLAMSEINYAGCGCPAYVPPASSGEVGK